MKIVTILGARPQFVKAATISRVIKQYDFIKEVIVHTGQHFDDNMSQIFFDEMNIPQPKYNLNVNNLSHGAMTGRMLEGIEKILLTEKPDWVIVYGDTNSTVAGALAASKLHIKVAHIEAGLRSFNMEMPEEINRILTDRISNVLFCPTDNAIFNLNREGYKDIKCKIVKAGDVMQDAAIFYSDRARKPKIDIPSQFILATIHRADNTDKKTKLENIIKGFNELNKKVPIILALHPRTKNIIKKYELQPEFTLIDPVSYFEMIYLLQNCNTVMTDSGGVQKEAFFFKKPCITIREETEWVELIEAEVNILAKAEVNSILEAYNIISNRKLNFDKDIYGGGNASNKIVSELLSFNKRIK